MITIHLYIRADGAEKIYEAPAVPRVGESVALGPDEMTYEVDLVVWYPDSPDFDVYVRAR